MAALASQAFAHETSGRSALRLTADVPGAFSRAAERATAQIDPSLSFVRRTSTASSDPCRLSGAGFSSPHRTFLATSACDPFRNYRPRRGPGADSSADDRRDDAACLDITLCHPASVHNSRRQPAPRARIDSVPGRGLTTAVNREAFYTFLQDWLGRLLRDRASTDRSAVAG